MCQIAKTARYWRTERLLYRFSLAGLLQEDILYPKQSISFLERPGKGRIFVLIFTVAIPQHHQKG